MPQISPQGLIQQNAFGVGDLFEGGGGVFRVMAQIFLKNMQVVPQFFLITRSNEMVPGFLEKRKTATKNFFSGRGILFGFQNF